jgi:diacylglycerol O-acyltransferase-2
LILSKFKFSPPIILGKGWFGCPVGICPRDVPLHIVTGTPISVPLVENPSEEDVAKYQKLYQTALEKLYAENETHYYEEIVPEHQRLKARPTLQVVA